MDYSPPRMSVLRDMKPGQVCAFDIGDMKEYGQHSAGPATTAITYKIGGKFTQRTIIAVDPVDLTAHKLLLVKCVEPANPRKKTGRPRKEVQS